jgi:hypothetical protein
MATLAEIKVVLGLLSIAYPNYVAKPGTAELYHSILESIPLDALQEAGRAYLASNNPFFPHPGALYQGAMDIVKSKNNLPSGMEAWGEVVAAFENVGMYREPTFTHPLIGNIVNQMGWQNLCQSENGMADRARFIDAYSASLNNYVSDTRMLPSVRQVADKYALQAGDLTKQLSDKWSAK